MKIHNILVVYFAAEFPIRAAIHDHLYSFQRNSPHRVFYLNIAAKRVPAYFAEVEFDLVIFHTLFLSRWNPDIFRRLVSCVRQLKNVDAPMIALPQDEFLNIDLFVDFVNDFGVRHVFSVSPPSEWPKLYGRTDPGRTKIHQVMTGYLDTQTVDEMDRLAKQTGERSIDIGYRAYQAAPWLGRFGRLKHRLADVVAQEAPQHGLVVDISTKPQDTFLGMDWYQFLLRCKYALGVEGGSSINDHDGQVKQRTEAYLARHPHASFEDVERECFEGLDGNLDLAALSPRHLEACATRTCQVLVEGSYNGILKPGVHYIALKRDFSNVAEVCEIVSQDHMRGRIVDNAYRDIVQSQRFTYGRFVEFVIGMSLEGTSPKDRRGDDDVLHGRAVDEDKRSWKKVQRMSAIVRRIPTNIRGVGRVTSWLRRLYLATR